MEAFFILSEKKMKCLPETTSEEHIAEQWKTTLKTIGYETFTHEACEVCVLVSSYELLITKK